MRNHRLLRPARQLLVFGGLLLATGCATPGETTSWPVIIGADPYPFDATAVGIADRAAWLAHHPRLVIDDHFGNGSRMAMNIVPDSVTPNAVHVESFFDPFDGGDESLRTTSWSAARADEQGTRYTKIFEVRLSQTGGMPAVIADGASDVLVYIQIDGPGPCETDQNPARPEAVYYEVAAVDQDSPPPATEVEDGIVHVGPVRLHFLVPEVYCASALH